MLDAHLGWRPPPGFSNDREHVNAQGLRSTREYAPVPAPGVLRIAAFGDSFVYGAEVATEISPGELEVVVSVHMTYTID